MSSLITKESEYRLDHLMKRSNLHGVFTLKNNTEQKSQIFTIKDKPILKVHFCFGFLCTFNINYRWLFIYKRMVNLLINQDFSSRLIDPEVFLKNYSFQQHTINGNLIIISLIYISVDRQSWSRPYQSFFEERPVIHIKWLGQEQGWQGGCCMLKNNMNLL